MIVVSDTSAVTNLIGVHRIEILRDLFGVITVPPAVHDELMRHHVSLPDFVHVKELASRGPAALLMSELDPGESEAIALAIELKADFLLVDEKLGRAAAERHGIPVIGLLGVLLLAKKHGLLPSVRDVIDQLVRDTGFFLSAEVRSRALSLAGEN